MTDPSPDSAFVEDAPKGLLSLPEQERERLSEALQELLASGSINGLEPSQTALYHWCRQYLEWLQEIAALSGLDVALLHEERLVQATPRIASLRLRLRQDATLVWLALWYAADVRWRDEGQDQAFLSVAELNDLLQDQLLPDATAVIPRARLREILRQAVKFNLVRLEAAEPFEESGIEILPAIRRVIPFRDLAAWAETAAAFGRVEKPADAVEEELQAVEEES
ncbi:DUF4194 domain-containing protein [Luteolibacter sp. GHJ8]|uniref:DUF4194 domain-containing protein n=1 Tax=Luteolibacter rhizosphaerae TaxID=2989719 RepID=A0ABT3G708_9BACT|nr:DUF4194 domain-containing protein [Luteolibacter rhizosphaerae]MCW1915354.1 DUF4194 domain-containing protein [Luteolibacter rhizosphaerae]